MEVQKAYKFRMFPDQQQQDYFWHNILANRYIYNIARLQKDHYYSRHRKQRSAVFDVAREFTILKAENDFVKKADSLSLIYSMRALDQAYVNFFEGRANFPKSRNKKHKSYVTYRLGIYIDEGFIKFPKVNKPVKTIFHRDFPEGAVLKSQTISTTGNNEWYISCQFECTEELFIKKEVKEETTIGIDVGIKDFAILSDGTKYDNNRYQEKSLKKLKRLQHELERRVAYSNGWYETRNKISALHSKIVHQRNDYQHKISTKIISNFDTVVREDLNIKGMLKNHHLARVISDAAWGMFFQKLQYKADWKGKNVIKVPQFVATTKPCSACGWKNDTITLKDRVWICEKCGTKHDRDINAAKNIKAYGLNIKYPELTGESTTVDNRQPLGAVDEAVNPALTGEKPVKKRARKSKVSGSSKVKSRRVST